jgi:hypothetical protein
VGERNKGRWVDDVELDLNMGVKRWRTRTLDRIELASIVKEAKARLTGL